MTAAIHPEKLCADTLRVLAAEAVERARSGHPGLPLGLADAAVALWARFLKFDPSDPEWPDRDRFVLSAGHGSMLLYGLLHLAGYDLPMDELRRFRQWQSRTPGHPEAGETPGVEVTTGPLGQGLGNAVGMALAERMLAARFNSNRSVVDHRTFVLASDGDLMEGVGHEAASLAGHLRLGKLVVLYDSNTITIEGSTRLAFSEDVPARFAALGWNTAAGVDGHDSEAVARALANALADPSRPWLIELRTKIGYGAPGLEGTAKVHGAPLGAQALAGLKERLGRASDPEFHVPTGAGGPLLEAAARGASARKAWQDEIAAWQAEQPEAFASWRQALAGDLPERLERLLPDFAPSPKGLSTRAASGETLAALAKHLPSLIGGSADLAPSNNTLLPDVPSVGPGEFSGRNLHFGVREHAMGAILNGIASHGGFIPYGGTFLVFSDYMRPSIRLAALMKLRVVYVFTHDSIGVGEDGPTHQPVEQLLALRAIPNLHVIRPGDAAETAQAWLYALGRREGPTALILSRQNLPLLDRTLLASAAGLRRGAYVLRCPGRPRAILIASGSELAPALAAADLLEKKGIPVRVVSMPCWEAFEAEEPAWRAQVLPDQIGARLSVEAGITLGWDRWTGPKGGRLGLDHFGASAPGEQLFLHFGFAPEVIAGRLEALLQAQ